VPELRISDVRVSVVQANFEWGFVKVYAGELYGVGEASNAPGLKAMEPYLRRLLVGEDAFRVRRILEKLRYAFAYSGTTVWHVISAVDIALHDLIGKYLNVPLWRLLGGDRDRIRVYVDAHASKSMEVVDAANLEVEAPWVRQARFETERMVVKNEPMVGRVSTQRWNEDYAPENYAKRAKEIVNEGFNAVKFDLDIPTPYLKDYNVRSGQLSLRDIDYLVSVVRAVREAVGDDVDIMFDLHWRFDVNTAIKLCKALEPYRLRWLEDPTPALTSLTINLEELELITRNCSIPIASGENMYGYYQFKDMLKAGIRVWTPDLAKAGGITEGLRISDLAYLYDIEISPHNIGSPIATLAAAHVMSAAGTFGVLEWHAHDLPFWGDIIKPKRRIIDKGFVVLTEDPGLGVNLDEDVMKRLWPNFEL